MVKQLAALNLCYQRRGGTRACPQALALSLGTQVGNEAFNNDNEDYTFSPSHPSFLMGVHDDKASGLGETHVDAPLPITTRQTNAPGLTYVFVKMHYP